MSNEIEEVSTDSGSAALRRTANDGDGANCMFVGLCTMMLVAIAVLTVVSYYAFRKKKCGYEREIYVVNGSDLLIKEFLDELVKRIK